MNTATPMKSPTRADYMAGRCTFEEFYRAVNATAGITIADRNFLDRCREALKTDEHLNNIPLSTWDMKAANAQGALTRALRAHGDFYLLSGGVCCMKQAARDAVTGEGKGHVIRWVAGILLHKNGDNTLRAATGPRYGRIWNSDIVHTLVQHFGNGIGDSDWRVPGEFGKAVTISKANTTLFAGDRDMFIFLADEKNRIEIPNRRNGAGMMARGFFMWNSEVGAKTWGLATFLFDYVCCNRIVWGAEGYQEITIRHTASAPDRFIEEIQPALETYRQSSTAGITQAIEDARAKRLDKVEDFLAERFGKRLVPALQAVHMLEEQRPIETLWDATVAATAHAKTIKWQDDRVDLEKRAGALLKLAA